MVQSTRRSFLTGFAAALATTALVKLPAPEPTAWIGIDPATGGGDAVYWMGNNRLYMICSNSQWLDLTRDLTDWSDRSDVSEGEIGEYLGITFR